MQQKPITVEDIELPEGLLCDEFYICTLQLKSPFWDEVTKVRKDLEYIGWLSDESKARAKKIKTLLDTLDHAINKMGTKIDILVFPEYAIEKSMMDSLEKFSYKHKIIVVVGYYDDEERQSIADVLIPYPNEIKHYKQYKLCPSRYDEIYLSNVKDENQRYLRFLWQPYKNKTERNFVHIFVCIDFLSNAIKVVDTRMAGLIIVSMCSPKTEAFYGISEYFMRAVEGNKSIVVSLCNSTDISTQENGMKACGESQIVGPYAEKQLPEVDNSFEGGIIAKVKLNSTLTVPTRIHSEEVISSVKKFFIENDGLIKDTKNSDLQNFALNPNIIISNLGLRKIYVFYNVKNYYDFRQYAKKIYLPMQGHGIFGVYDVLFVGYEENWDFFELRLTSYLGAKYTDLVSPDKRNPDHYVITEVLKYRGKELMDISNERFCPKPMCSDLELYGYLEDNIKHIRNVCIGKDIQENKKNDFKEKGIIFPTESNSDITYEELKKGLEEYMVFLFLYPSGEISIQTVMREFQQHVLPTMMKDKRIRTVEFSSEQIGINYPKGTYIFHIVGKLDDLRDIILNYIHKPLYEKEIICGTRVVPTAESLSNEEYLSLNETVLFEPSLRSTVREIIFYLKYSNRFIIKQLKIETIKKIARFYTAYKTFVKENVNSKSETASHEMIDKLDQLDQFIYGFCIAALNQDKLNEEIFETLRGRCAVTFNSIVIRIEDNLADLREHIRSNMINNPEENIKSQYLAKLKNEKIFTDTKQTILGNLATDLHKWNTRIAREEDRILDSNFTEAVGKLQSVVPYRNYFSHAYKDFENKKTSEFAIELLNSTLIAFDFVKNYSEKIEEILSKSDAKNV